MRTRCHTVLAVLVAAACSRSPSASGSAQPASTASSPLGAAPAVAVPKKRPVEAGPGIDAPDLTFASTTVAQRFAGATRKRIVPPRLEPEPSSPRIPAGRGTGTALGTADAEDASRSSAGGPTSASPAGAPPSPTYPTLKSRAAGTDGSTTVVEFPLRHTRVDAEVSGNIARVEVQQFYVNPSTDKLEAVYAFPLPENAAVTDMFFRIGKRVVMSDVKEKGEARQTYETAKREGKTSALTEEERPNLFTQSVANIPPGETVVVTIRYVHEVPYDSGRYKFHFPMTVGPRYIPGTIGTGAPAAALGVAPTAASGAGWSPDTTRVPDASRITPPMIPPGFRSAHDIEVLVHLQPAGAFADLAALSHRVVTAEAQDGSQLVTLAEDDRIPNKDFVLEYRPAGEEPEAFVLAQKQMGDGYFMVFVQPPVDVLPRQVRPKEVVFLLDKSGSMSGRPIDTAINLVDRTLEELGPDDTFQIFAFDGDVYSMSERALSSHPENRVAARRWLSTLSGGGGTEMLPGILAALRMPADPSRVRMVVFATDGYIGNEDEIIRAVRTERGSSRVFAFGVGSSVNRYLVAGIAKAGAGADEYVRLDEDPETAATRLFRRLDRPVVTDLTLAWDGLSIRDVTPDPVPDLMAGQPLVLVGRYGKPGKGALHLRGMVGSRAYERDLAVEFSEKPDAAPVLGTLWARRRVDQLSWESPPNGWGGGSFGGGPTDAGRREIIDLALHFKLITPYTSFVAVEKELLASKSIPLETVLVPNEMPEGVSYQKIFGSAAASAGEVTITPSRVKPGDPELRVRAPAWANDVQVLLPFGGAPKHAVYDPETREHVARFLVPFGWPQGAYTAAVVMRGEGREERREAPIKVDTTPAALAVVSAPTAVQPGDIMILKFKPALPLERAQAAGAAASVRDAGEALKSAMDVKEVLVQAPWGDVERARMEGALGMYVARLRVPRDFPAGVARLEAAASDAAGNVSRREVLVNIGSTNGEWRASGGPGRGVGHGSATEAAMALVLGLGGALALGGVYFRGPRARG